MITRSGSPRAKMNRAVPLPKDDQSNLQNLVATPGSGVAFRDEAGKKSCQRTIILLAEWKRCQQPFLDKMSVLHCGRSADLKNHEAAADTFSSPNRKVKELLVFCLNADGPSVIMCGGVTESLVRCKTDSSMILFME